MLDICGIFDMIIKVKKNMFTVSLHSYEDNSMTTILTFLVIVNLVVYDCCRKFWSKLW